MEKQDQDFPEMGKIEQFVKRYEKRSHHTMNNYRYILQSYFKTIQQQPNTYFTKRNETQIKQDITRYWDTISEQAPKSRDLKLACIKSFLIWNEIEIKTRFYKELRESIKEKGALTEDYVPKTIDLQKMIQHANIRERAWILLASSSGMRIGEILKLEQNMLHLDQDPPYIQLPGRITKNGKKRFTFCTPEARDAIIEWLQVRTTYLQKINGKNNLPHAKKVYHDPEDRRIFPFQYYPISCKFNQLTDIIKKGKKDERTKRAAFHIHCLRKYAKTRMQLSMPDAMVDFIIGHSGYLPEYDVFEVEQIAPHYKKAMNDLCVFSSPDNEETQQRIMRLERENREMKEDIDRLMRKIVAQ